MASRTSVSAELDVVVAYSSPGNMGESAADGGFWWNDRMKLGIFLQSRAEPGLVYKIAMENGPDVDEGRIHVERATATDVVLLHSPEKGRAGPYRKYVYDIRAKALVKTVVYKPYSLKRVAVSGGKTVFVGDDPERPVALEYLAESTPPFRLLRGPEALRYMTPESKPVLPRAKLPQSTFEEFADARAERVKNGYSRKSATIEEAIGPSQLVDGTQWFGKTFYDGEGHTGVGGFGYFDVEKKAYRIYSPEAVRNHSASAILVEPEAAWLGLVHNGEWGSTGAGLIRFDRATERVDRFELPEIVGGIARVGERILLATERGVAVLDGTVPRRYIVDETTDGRLRVVELVMGL